MAKRRKVTARTALQRAGTQLTRGAPAFWDSLVEAVYTTHRERATHTVRAGVTEAGKVVLVSTSDEALRRVSDALTSGATLEAVKITAASPEDVAAHLGSERRR